MTVDGNPTAFSSAPPTPFTARRTVADAAVRTGACFFGWRSCTIVAIRVAPPSTTTARTAVPRGVEKNRRLLDVVPEGRRPDVAGSLTERRPDVAGS